MTPQKDNAVKFAELLLSKDTDVVRCRNQARIIAEAFHFDRQQQVKIATAVSEIARNAHRYARHGRVSFSLLKSPRSSEISQWLITTVSDQGAGIANLPEVLAGTYRSKTGMGMGIRGAKRLMDRVDIQSGGTGTIVDLWLKLPRGVYVTDSELEGILQTLNESMDEDPLEELATQNRDLVSTLEQVSIQSQTLEQVNMELRETNRGVVALYDELDTVHRIGRVVASNLDLTTLLRAITDATTELSDAKMGAFLLLSPHHDEFTWQCVSGQWIAEIPESPPPKIDEVILDENADIFRFEGTECPQPLAADLGLQSILVCPLRDESRALLGALFLGHTEERAFSERTERILPTIAVQAAIGVTNAKLYHRVQTANEAKAQFIAVLSHELRTPLNPVFAILTSLEEHPALPEDARANLVVMRRNLQLEATLIDDLLDLTRVSEGKLALKLKPLDLRSLIHAVVHTCNAEIERKQISITLELFASEHFVSGDEVRLQQALWNLVNNAVKFTPEKGAVKITTRSEVERVTVSIIDTGRGIEPEALERVFTAFEQENEWVSSRFGGLGLGLAISKGIVEAHHGTIQAESQGANQGSHFSISLPTIAPPSQMTSTPSSAAKRKSAPSLRLMIVDDHDDTRMIMASMLQMRGHVVTEAASVTEALQKYHEGTFDLLVSDLGLPDGNGHDLIRQMLKIKPILGIALSGYGMESDLARSRDAGFSKHLIKPIDFEKLDLAIEEVSRLLGGQA